MTLPFAKRPKKDSLKGFLKSEEQFEISTFAKKNRICKNVKGGKHKNDLKKMKKPSALKCPLKIRKWHFASYYPTPEIIRNQ